MCTQFIRNQIGMFIEIWKLRKPLSNEQWLEGFMITIFRLKPNFYRQQQMWVIFHPMIGVASPSCRKFWSGPLWNTVCLQSFTQRTLLFHENSGYLLLPILFLEITTHLWWRDWEIAPIVQVFGHSGCVREGYGAFQRCSLAGEGTSVGTL